MQFCKRYHVLIAIWINLISYRCFIEYSDSAKIQTFYLHFFQDWLSIFCVHSLHINAPFSILMPISGHTIVPFLSQMDGRYKFFSIRRKLDFATWEIVAMPIAACAKFRIRKSGVFGNIWWLGKLLAAIISATGIARFISPHTRPTTVYTPTLQGYTPGQATAMQCAYVIHLTAQTATLHYIYRWWRRENFPQNIIYPLSCHLVMNKHSCWIHA